MDLEKSAEYKTCRNRNQMLVWTHDVFGWEQQHKILPVAKYGCYCKREMQYEVVNDDFGSLRNDTGLRSDDTRF